MIETLSWRVPLTIISVNLFFLTFWILSLRFSVRQLGEQSPNKIVFITVGILIGWITLQGVLAFNGFYLNFGSRPPRFIFAIGPPLATVFVSLILSRSYRILEAFPLTSLTYVHTARVFVELVVWALFLEGKTPKLMTFAGRNLDIVVGLTAPIVGYLCFTRNILSRKLALIWHVIGLAFLVNISILFIFSVPSPFQILAVEQANVAFFYFPFIWAPSHGVPTVILAHCIAIRKLLGKTTLD